MMTGTPERENFPTFQSVWDTGTGKDGSQRKLQVSEAMWNDDSPNNDCNGSNKDASSDYDDSKKSPTSRYSLFSSGVSARALWSVSSSTLSNRGTTVEAWECEECGHENYNENEGECELCGTGICFMDERKNKLRDVERQLFVEEYGVDDDENEDGSPRSSKKSPSKNKTTTSSSLRDLLSRHPSFQQKKIPTKQKDGDSSLISWASANTTPTANLSPASAFSPVSGGSPVSSSSAGSHGNGGDTNSPEIHVIDSSNALTSTQDVGMSFNRAFRDEAVDMEKSRRHLRSGACLTPPVILFLLVVIMTIALWVPFHNKEPSSPIGDATTTTTSIADGLWVPRAESVFGDEPDYETGASVALASSGGVMAVGVGKYGPVRAYDLDDEAGVWTQRGQDVSLSDGPKHVALSRKHGKVMAVASESDGSVAALSYDDISDEWTPLGEPLLFGVTNRDDARASVALSDTGKVLAVGVPSEGSHLSDSVRIFGYDKNTTSWTPIGEDVVLDAEIEVQHGGSVSLSSNGMVLAVGSWSVARSTYSSHAEVYRYSNNTWTQVGGITNIGLRTSQVKSETSVSLSGDGTIVAVGSGEHCRIFQYNQEYDAWSQLGQELVGQTVSLSFDGKVLAVGNPVIDENSGNAIMYAYDEGSNRWVQIGDTIPGEVEGDSFGAAVSISEDGKQVVVGAPKSGDEVYHSGSVGLFALE